MWKSFIPMSPCKLQPTKCLTAT
jgi:predicted transcriptional regulator